jgi:hypothetical protein
MTNMGPHHHFLGITIECRELVMMVCSLRVPIFARYHGPCMLVCEISSFLVPLWTHSTNLLIIHHSSTFYHNIVGVVQYSIFTRLGIAYVVQQVYLHMHDPSDLYLAPMKRILRYL